jgi:hypothetical protein
MITTRKGSRVRELEDNSEVLIDGVFKVIPIEYKNSQLVFDLQGKKYIAYYSDINMQEEDENIANKGIKIEVK